MSAHHVGISLEQPCAGGYHRELPVGPAVGKKRMGGVLQPLRHSCDVSLVQAARRRARRTTATHRIVGNAQSESRSAGRGVEHAQRRPGGGAPRRRHIGKENAPNASGRSIGVRPTARLRFDRCHDTRLAPLLLLRGLRTAKSSARLSASERTGVIVDAGPRKNRFRHDTFSSLDSVILALNERLNPLPEWGKP